MFEPHNNPPENPRDSILLVFQEGKLVTDMRSPEACLLPETHVREDGWIILREQFVGFWHGRPCYAVEMDGAIELDPMRYQAGSLYQILGRVDEQVFAMAGRASQLLDWERDHQFCGRCGQPMEVDRAERAMRCRPCRAVHYPKIAPCIIVLVTRGEELLLARNANFPEGLYSTLAGFIEPGETAEETLVREVREEVGVEVGNLRYFTSQSWPFPSQLMLGFFAEHSAGDIVCDEIEIADAQWFHYRELPQVPPPSSVAGALIRHHVNLFT